MSAVLVDSFLASDPAPRTVSVSTPSVSTPVAPDIQFSLSALVAAKLESRRRRNDSANTTLPPTTGPLAAYRLPVRVDQATAILDTLCDQVRIVELYQHYFPTELAASSAELGDIEE